MDHDTNIRVLERLNKEEELIKSCHERNTIRVLKLIVGEGKVERKYRQKKKLHKLNIELTASKLLRTAVNKIKIVANF